MSLCVSLSGWRTYIDPWRHIAEGTTDAVIFCLRNHGDSPFSDLLCLLPSLSKDVHNTHTDTHTHSQADEAGFREVRYDWWLNSWQSRVTGRQTDPGAGFSLWHNVGSFIRRPAGCSVCLRNMSVIQTRPEFWSLTYKHAWSDYAPTHHSKFLVKVQEKKRYTAL